jgi:hypothetical protein
MKTTSIKKSASTHVGGPVKSAVKGSKFTKHTKKNFQSGDWVAYVYDENGNRERTIAFAGSAGMSYSQIRSTYNRETKLRRFDDIRACRVSNF